MANKQKTSTTHIITRTRCRWSEQTTVNIFVFEPLTKEEEKTKEKKNRNWKWWCWSTMHVSACVYRTDRVSDRSTECRLLAIYYYWTILCLIYRCVLNWMRARWAIHTSNVEPKSPEECRSLHPNENINKKKSTSAACACTGWTMSSSFIYIKFILFPRLTMNNAVILHLGHGVFGHFADHYQKWTNERTNSGHRTMEHFNWWHNFLVFPLCIGRATVMRLRNTLSTSSVVRTAMMLCRRQCGAPLSTLNVQKWVANGVCNLILGRNE